MTLNSIREGVFNFDDWNFESEHQKMEAKFFAEYINNTLANFPPMMSITLGNEEGPWDDLGVQFHLDEALGNPEPSWTFSLKDELTWFKSDIYKYDAIAIRDALKALLDHVQIQIDQMPDDGSTS
jgi:hypothetical protein